MNLLKPYPPGRALPEILKLFVGSVLFGLALGLMWVSIDVRANGSVVVGYRAAVRVCTTNEPPICDVVLSSQIFPTTASCLRVAAQVGGRLSRRLPPPNFRVEYGCVLQRVSGRVVATAD